MSAEDNSTPLPALSQLQGWMQSVITHPEGIGPGLASEEARRALALHPDAITIASVVASTSTLSGAERLAIYSRSYHARLQQCFQSMFPVLRRALGEALFARFVMDYLQHHPPGSYTLDHLADHFPEHLAETRPDAAAPPDRRERWPDFIIDLATLERAFLKVYDGPGLEGRALPGHHEIRAMSDERVLTTRPVPAPCLRLYAFRYPVHIYLRASRGGETPELPAPLESFVALTRRDYRVMLSDLSSSPQYAFLQLLDGRRTVTQALREIAHPDCDTPPVAAIRAWLSDWAAGGFFQALENSLPAAETKQT
jgi:hypothetical protein